MPLFAFNPVIRALTTSLVIVVTDWYYKAKSLPENGHVPKLPTFRSGH